MADDVKYSDLVNDPQQSAVISNLDIDDVLALARENQSSPTGFDSMVGRALVIARGMLGSFEYPTDLPSFNDDSIFGGMEELKQDIADSNGTWLSSTLSAGSTSIVFTDNSILSTSIIEVFADNGNLYYTSIAVDGSNHTCTIGFPAQSSAVVVDIWVR